MTPSPKPEDRLFEGDCCCLCGRYNQCDTAGDHTCPPFKYCHACKDEFGGRDVTCKTVVGVHAEVTRRKSLAANPKPAVENSVFKAGDWVEYDTAGGRNVAWWCYEHSIDLDSVGRLADRAEVLVLRRELRKWQPQVGEMCEGIVAPGVNAAGETFRGKLQRYDNVGDGSREAVLHSDDEAAWVIPGTLRPAPTPSTATSEQKAASRCDFRLLNGLRCERPEGHTDPHCGRAEPKAAEPYAGPLIDDAVNTERVNRQRRVERAKKAESANAGYILKPGPDGLLPVVGLEINKLVRAESSLDRLAAKRAAVLVDLNTPSRTRRDRLGRKLGAFESWISTVHAKDSK